VLAQGKLIFQGTLTDLKGRIRKNHYELDLDGDQKSISKAVGLIKALKDMQQVILRQRRLEVRLSEDIPNSQLRPRSSRS